MPKIIGSTLEEHRETTRQRVFDALVTLLDTHSFDAISMADLAAEAGIGRTSIYNHFADREAVILGFTTSQTDEYLARLDAVLEGVEGPTERLAVYLRHHIERRGDQHFGFGPEVYALLSDEARVELRAHVVVVERVVRSIFADGVAAGEFRVDDVDASVALVHACLQSKQVTADAVVEFVTRAVRA